MNFYSSKEFNGSKAWDSQHIASFDNVSVKLHWTDQPYMWHINDGQEVFAVMDGCVEMQYKEKGEVKSRVLKAGDIFYASEGTEHIARPQGIARVLVIETEGSV
ncbi:3-hydroxyanthranilate 3,4-dioxygenase [Candidatus Pantoea varia]|uniref:3-hydroxyanthranilate 3,4-dioxygenase n=1 Tax=Candidatus Pantoea varia TaxID=1881036 RepID=A0A1I5EEB5_9GAMM|nr:cupin [Pantoea varia]SFO09693.1 3-hydroxyanthranilate 3,4-dioxygenase [Pantoea varia]